MDVGGSFHYTLSWRFSEKGQTLRLQTGTWGVRFSAGAPQNEIFLPLSFINIKRERSETKQIHEKGEKLQINGGV